MINADGTFTSLGKTEYDDFTDQLFDDRFQFSSSEEQIGKFIRIRFRNKQLNTPLRWFYGKLIFGLDPIAE